MQVSQFPQRLSITIFTDGSCHTQLKTGGWAAIILLGDEKIVLKGGSHSTTHQRMELTAVLESLYYLQQQCVADQHIVIYSDSQYVVDLLDRRSRLISSEFRTRKSKTVRNSDLVRPFLDVIATLDIKLQKIKSHQKRTSVETILNREVDLLSRKKMKELCAEYR